MTNGAVMGGDKPQIVPSVAVPLTSQSLELNQLGKYHTKGGHGFSAEDANHFIDLLRGRSAQVVGVTNEANGADRLVNGVLIQSKYFSSATQTMSSAFDGGGGGYRYAGQLLEVPRDQYHTCVELMRIRISSGRVPGHTNPADAELIVQRGTITYQQARNIAKPGKIESLVFDASSQAVTSTYVFAVSFAVAFAQSRWSGNDLKIATKEAVASGLVAGRTTLITGIVTAQLLRTKGASLGAVAIRSAVKNVSRTSFGREAVHRIAVGSLGRGVYGAAAANHVSKLLRTNVISGGVVALIASTPDFHRAILERSISWKQLSKNVSINVAGIASGTAGWLGGVAIGASIGSLIPVLGTAAGGIVGGVLGAVGGGMGGTTAAKKLADRIVTDDQVPLMALIQREFQRLAFEHLLTETETDALALELQEAFTPKWFRTLYKKSARGTDESALLTMVQEELTPRFEAALERRENVALPWPLEVIEEIQSIAIEVAAIDGFPDTADEMPRNDR